MKKLACLILVCSISGASFAFQSKGKVSPSVDNTSITKSKKEESHNIKNFQSDRRYGKVVKGHGTNKSKKQQEPKSQSGKGA